MEPDMSPLEMTKISWSPVFQVLILCFGALLSFITAYANGSVSIYVPFISETGAHSPEMCIFSFTLILGCIAGSIVVCYRNLVMRHLLANKSDKLKKLNNLGTVLGLISMIGLAGVAAVPMSTVYWLHLLAASVHFLFALLFIILQTFIHHFVEGASVMMRNFRIFLCVILMLLLLMLVIFFPLSYHKWKEANDHPQAIKKPEDKVFGMVLSAAFFEWALYGTFLTFILTFFFEFRHFRLSINVAPPATEKVEEN